LLATPPPGEPRTTSRTGARTTTQNRTLQLTVGIIGVLAFATAPTSAIVTGQVPPLTYLSLLVGVAATVYVVVTFVRKRPATPGLVTSLVSLAVGDRLAGANGYYGHDTSGE